jgi:uncharacterized protein
MPDTATASHARARGNKGLIIFAREPLPGMVKTRLGRDLGDHRFALELYTAMLADVLETVHSLEVVRPLVFWALKSGTVPSYAALPRLEMFEQKGRDLGERMQNAFKLAFEGGCTACSIIGTDSPDLPTEYIIQSYDQLDRGEADVVFGPAGDGGYYLLGMRRLHHLLFDDIAWSSSSVLRDSLERARKLGLRTHLLPEWYDIDTRNDLEAFLERSAGIGERTTAARTMAIALRQ